MFKRLFITLATLAFFASWGEAATNPYVISYGGRLTDSTGNAVVGPVTIRVTFHDAAINGSQIPVALSDFAGVQLSNGVFQIVLTLTESDLHTVFNSAATPFIQIEDMTHNKVYPRQSFSAVPYALKIPFDPLSFDYTTDGQLTLPITGRATGKVLKIDGSGAAVWDTDLNDSGTPTDHSHANATTGAAGFMSATDKSKLDGIANGAGVDTNTNSQTICSTGAYLRGDDGASVCKTAGEIVTEGAGVKTKWTCAIYTGRHGCHRRQGWH